MKTDFFAELHTASGLRLRCHTQQAGPLNWLLLPGGPGLGSESLIGLAEIMNVVGSIWLVDLPGDGSNTRISSATAYQKWPDVILEAVHVLPNCVLVGHSTGGMYLLSVPELEQHICGLALLSSAPDASWQIRFSQMVAENPLPAAQLAEAQFISTPSNESLRQLLIASAEWNFTPATLEAGRHLLAGLPYNLAALTWSSQHFDDTYTAKWWPRHLATLILSAKEDRIIDQGIWDKPQFQGPHILWRQIDHAAHFLWLDQPEKVRAALTELSTAIESQMDK